jgi:hypothetical protein
MSEQNALGMNGAFAHSFHFGLPTTLIPADQLLWINDLQINDESTLGKPRSFAGS